MKKLTIFYLDGCPYCRNAMRAVQELDAELPGFSSDQIKWIEERRNADIANQYDYYNVPTVFLDNQKLYECSPSDDYDTIKSQMECAIKKAFCD